MPGRPRYEWLPSGEARRRTRRDRVVGTTVILVLIGLIAWARIAQVRDGDEVALRDGAHALARAVGGDDAAFDEAIAHFDRASRAVVLDGYPMFAMELARQLQRGKVEVQVAELEPVVASLQAGNVKVAKARLDALPDPSKYGWLQRLLVDMLAP